MTDIVPFNDLGRMHLPLKSALEQAFRRVLDSQAFVLGPEVQAFEREFAAFCGCTHAVGVSSGSDALTAALRALGVGGGDEVIVPAFSYIASASTASALGARVVFCDIERHGYGLDPASVRGALTPKTRAIVLVHLFGRLGDVHVLRGIAQDAGVALVEDAAQAVGAEDGLGQRAGTFGDVGCHSFFPAKNLGALGDGGAVTTMRHDLADRVVLLRQHGGRPKYHHVEIGGNWRLDALQAALLRVKLGHLGTWTEQRRTAAQKYRELFAEAKLEDALFLPSEGEGRHVYNQFVVEVDGRERIKAELAARGIPTMVYYPEPLHLQPCFAGLGYPPGAFPNAEQACRRVLALPIFPGITVNEQARVVESLAAVVRHRW